MLPYKRCSGRCGRSLPATLDNFYTDKNRPDGLTACCKPCMGVRIRSNQLRRRNEPPATPVWGKKECHRCFLFLPYSDFKRSKSTTDGFYAWCKECDRKRDKELRNLKKSQKNPEKPL